MPSPLLLGVLPESTMRHVDCATPWTELCIVCKPEHVSMPQQRTVCKHNMQLMAPSYC